MITASQAFMNKVASGEVPSMRMQFIPATGDPFYLSDGDFWADSISFNEATSQSGEFTVGAAVIGEFNFTLNNFNGNLTDEIFAGAKVIPSVYYTINNTPEYLPKGVYYVASHKTNGNLIRVKAYDSMKLLDEHKTTITYPTTVQAVVEAICTACNITLATQTIPNGTYALSLAPEADMTDRQLLSAVCEITGNFARMDENGNLYVGWYDFDNPVTIASTFDGKDLWTLPIMLTGVRVNVYSGDNTYFYGTDDNVVTVSNNPLVYAGNGQEICNMIGARITGSTFRPGSLPILSNPCLQSGDVLEITDNITGDTYLLPITELTYTKGLTETVSCSFENTEDADLRPTIEGLLKKSIDEVGETASSALGMATETEQHFWFTSGTGSEAGAHIAEAAKVDFEQNPTGGNTLIRSNGVQIRDGTTVLASFGEAVQIGKDDNSHLEMDYHSLQLIDKDGDKYFYVSDLRNQNGRATITEKFIGDGTTRSFTLHFHQRGVNYVKYDDVEIMGPIIFSGQNLVLSTAPSAGSVVEVNYDSDDDHLKAFTFGERTNSNIMPGALSVVEGSGNAGGNYAHAEGEQTDASGMGSHAEGSGAVATGDYSHAQNYHTTASSDYQTVIGKYNVDDPSGLYAFIIGNGYYTGYPSYEAILSNALTVKWNGDVKTAGDVEDGNGNKLSSMGGVVFQSFNIAANGSKALTLPNSYRGVIYINGASNANAKDIVEVSTTTTGGVTYYSFRPTSQSILTYSSSSGSFTIATTAAVRVTIMSTNDVTPTIPS